MSDKVNKPAHYNQGSIECIDAMEQVLTAEEYRGFLKGNAIKYLWREKNKGGIEDLRKARWYLDRLIEHCDISIKPTESPKKSIELPDGWRWLEIGEVIRKGDEFFKDDNWWDYDLSIGERIWDGGWPSIRSNRFEVGEKVVEVVNNRAGVVKDIEAIGNCKSFLYYVEMQDTKAMVLFSQLELAPYIEDAT